MNPLQRLVAEARSVPVAVRRTTAEVTDAYLDGGRWRVFLKEVAIPQDHKAVEALEGLLDLARSNQWTDLQQAAEDRLGQFPHTSSAGFAARLVVSPTTDDILFAFDTDNTGEAKPMWERAIERRAALGGRDAFNDLVALRDLRDSRLSGAVDAHLRKMQDTAEASMHADINRVLGTAVPYREAGRHTQADGNCLIHALLGTVSQNIYRCEPGTVRQVRQQLSEALALQDPEELPPSIALAVRGVYEDLQEVSLCTEGSDLPNRKALEPLAQQLGPHLHGHAPFEQLAVEAQSMVLHACADFFAQPGHYLPCALVPLLAQVSKRAVSLYAEPDGWRHYGADGQPCGPTQDAVAIRFHARRQHYERVEGPLEFTVPDEPKAQRVPHFDVASRFQSSAMSTASFSTRTGSTSSLSAFPASARAPLGPRKEGLVTRFFNWAGRLFR